MTSSNLPGRPSGFPGVDTSLPVEELRVSFYDVLSANVNCMTPWQCYCKSVEIFLPNLNFSCKESASNWIDFDFL